jgi:hypothetical protein
MMDCRTFLKFQSAMESNQGAHQGGKSTSQGYQVQRLAKHLESKVYISAMIQLVQKSKKERKSISRQVNLVIFITTSYYRVLEMVRSTSQVQQNRPPEESAQARARANGVKGANRGVRC